MRKILTVGFVLAVVAISCIGQTQTTSNHLIFKNGISTDSIGGYTGDSMIIDGEGLLKFRDDVAGELTLSELYSSGLSLGAQYQVPYVNTAATDFSYSSNFTYNGTTLGLNGTFTTNNINEYGATGVLLEGTRFDDDDITLRTGTTNVMRIETLGGYAYFTSQTGYGMRFNVPAGEQMTIGPTVDASTFLTLRNPHSTPITSTFRILSASGGNVLFRVDESGPLYATQLGSDDTEDHVIAIDDATGLLSKRSVTSIGGGSYTFDSGLTETAGNVDLGGTINQATTLDAGTYAFNIRGTNSTSVSGKTEVTQSASYLYGFSSSNWNTSGEHAVILAYGNALNSEAAMEVWDPSLNYSSVKLDSDGGGLIVTDQISSDGFYYAADYSSGATDRWIPDKAYVDASGGSYTFDEGLTETAGNVDLGGAFDANILISSTNSNNLELRTGNGTDYSWIRVESGNTAVIGTYDQGTGDVNTIEIDHTELGVTDEINSKGLVYAADYSTNYTARSLPDLAHVQSEISDSIQDHIDDGVEGMPVARNVNNQTGTTYTFVLGDRDDIVTFGSASATTVTVPPNSSVAFPIGITIDCIQIGAGTVTFAAGSGVTLNSLRGLVSEGQYATFTLMKIATDTWILNKNTY